MIISIASGKGGTGKTTVATNLAFCLGKEAQILDCDVEEPNVHLFLNPEIEERQDVHTLVPKVDEEKCNFCRKCMEICRFRAITVIAKTVLVFEDLCHSCGGCMVVCPEKAISETGRLLGVIEKGAMGELEFVHGRLRVGEAMSPPLIKKVRSYVKSDKINIIDAPPGTSCPVIAAMKDVDFVLLVTEPTPFGLHDLKPAVEAVKLLEIPCGLVINRSDMGDDSVVNYAARENLPVLLQIPFDRRIAVAYSNGRLIVQEMPQWQEKFLQLFERIKKLSRTKGGSL